MLLMSESIILEVLDEEGRPVAPGELGEAVMTGLCSDAQPFIRYRTGDMVRMSAERVPRRARPARLDEVMGRHDRLRRPARRHDHARAGGHLRAASRSRASPSSSSSSTTVRDVEVLVVPGAALDRRRPLASRSPGSRQAGRRRARRRSASSTPIPPEASGKYRYVVSHVRRCGVATLSAARPVATSR